ncbi:MAG: hypothetical protein Q7S92_02640 [Candidatus Diapherotrites archaeon]|nr:hypothetical protein [Candidatus Diapherotrites archaeon]
MVELKDFACKPCSSRTGYDFLPKQSMNLSLEKIAESFHKQGIQVEANTPVVLLLVIDSVSTSLFQNGKILVKDLKQESQARIIADKVVHALNQSKIC